MVGIRAKLLGFTTLIVLFVSVPLTVHAIHMSRSQILDTYREDAMQAGNILADDVFNDLYRLDWRAMRLRLGAIYTNKSIKVAFVLNRAGEVWADGTEENRYRGLRLEDPFVPRILGSKGWVVEVGGSLLKMGRPIVLDFEDEEPLGWLYLQLSLEEINRKLKEQFKECLIIFGVCILFGFALFLSMRFTRPINQLIDQAEALGKGNLDSVIRLANRDELGRLAATLDIMRIDLRDSYAALQNNAKEILAQHVEETKLREAKVVAEAASQAKSTFLANMSHEIRTPMNAILGMSHLCLQTETTPQQQDYLDKIHGSANALLHIINDILDFSKIEAGKMVVEAISFHLSDVLNDLATLITVKIQKKNVEIIFDMARGVPRILLGDPIRLGQILTNLLNNALKFTSSGEIVLSIERVEETDCEGMLQFSVRDTGIGMTPDQLDRLFKAFSQADDSTTRKYGGTGLGLTISKHLVELMGGTLWVSSVAGQGSVFSFTIRFGFPKKEDQAVLRFPEEIRHKKVLIVDDNQTSREILRTAMESFSFQVTVASSGMAALILLEKTRQEGKGFDLLLLDWHMPNLDGVQTFHCLKSLETAFDVPTIFMVPYTEQAHVKQRIGSPQPSVYIDKPVQLSTLFDSTMTLFGQEASPSAVKRRDAALSLAPSEAIVGARVLLVEDNEINQQVGKELLEMLGIVVEIANNGLEAVQTVENAGSEFELLLMDIQMPIMDGYQATRKIRALPQGVNLPIVAMTANVMAQDLVRCQEEGMDDHIAKPVDPSKLLLALNKWIKPQERGQERGRGMGEAMDMGMAREMGTAKETETEILQQGCSVDQENQEADIFPLLPGIDTQSGLFRVGGNAKLLRSLLVKFAETHAPFVADIQEAMAKGNTQQARRMAHTLKGVAGTIGALRLQALAAALESSLLFPPGFTEELNLVLGSIHRLTSSSPEEHQMPRAQATMVDPVVLLHTLEQLKSPIQKRRPKYCEPILEELAQMAFPSDMVRDMDTLAKLVNTYKMKEAISVLDTMIMQLSQATPDERQA